MSEQNMNHMQEELKQKAMEHDISDAQAANINEVGQVIEEGVANAYQKIEEAVVGSYKKIEDTVVLGYTKIEDKFVDMYLTKDGETVEQAKKRLKKEQKA